MAYKLTKQRRARISAFKAADRKKPKKYHYEMTQLDHMIMDDMKHRMKKPAPELKE